jgi:hypothetical protein
MTTFPDVAKRLADDPPQWLLQALEEFANLIRQPRSDPETETIERKMFRYAEYIQRWLELYRRLEKYGFELEISLDDIDTKLEELRQFLDKELTHSTSGDPRRKLCAAVCVEGYRLFHDHVQPHSGNLRQTCEDLWQACGNPTTQTAEGVAKGSDVRENWRRSLEDVAAGDQWVRSRFELYKSSTKII